MEQMNFFTVNRMNPVITPSKGAEITLESVRELYDQGNKEILVKYSDGESEKLRLFITSDNGLCYYRKGSRRWGYRLSNILHRIESIRGLKKSAVDEAATWRKSWQGVVDRLNKSGLWADYKAEAELALALGYETMRELYRIYNKSFMDRNDDQNIAIVKAYSPDLIGTRTDGSEYVDWSIIWTFAQPPKVKKMRFYQGAYNEKILAQIKDHMDLHLKFEVSGRTSYDVSFEYNPEINKAWYSEEYRNCGNGHYYLALDATHAVFSEDD